jgi:Asp-tRNA(Asn)/Glu-tRNA(Gln) amidotransferase A subunit family amidase
MGVPAMMTGPKISITLFVVSIVSVPLLAEPVTSTTIAEFEKIVGLSFTPAQHNQIVAVLNNPAYWGNSAAFDGIRSLPLSNSSPPALNFNPIPSGYEFETVQEPILWSPPTIVTRPTNTIDLVFLSVRDLGELIRTGQLTSLELTNLYLDRLKQFDPKLLCVITLTKELALSQAMRADAEIEDGYYRGPLHGIPYGIKDLFAKKTYPTTWGAAPFKDQVIDEDAYVVQKLEEAGAVLVAKLTMGALAQGDVWYGGKTRNPWNLNQGSSGSSAGPASATAAGLVPFAIGTETLGSIVSPCHRCRVTGLRPTYGRVSRTGAMNVSWSLDKIGPICRSVEDCAIVLDAIRGPDGNDIAVVDVPFNYDPNLDLSTLTIGYRPDVNTSIRNRLASIVGESQWVQMDLPNYPYAAISLVLDVEAAAAFDELTRSKKDSLLVAQGPWDWPNLYRTARTIPAVEYVQADRLRYKLIQEMAVLMSTVDVWVASNLEDASLFISNLTGQPCVVIPHGGGTSLSFIGRLYDEATILALAKSYQDATTYHLSRPSEFTKTSGR